MGALVPRLARPVLKRKAPGVALLMADWAAVVGPALAAVTTPRKLTQGTLTIACPGPVAMELTHLAPQLIERINGHLGRAAVERLRFMQIARPAGAAAPRPRPAATLPPRVADGLAKVPGDELREALEKLARAVYRNPR